MICIDRAIQDNFLSYRFFGVRAFIVQKFTDLQRSAVMAQGQKIHPQVQWAVIRLSKLLKNDQIAVSRSLDALNQTDSFAFFSAWDHPIPRRGGSREAPGQIPSSGCGCRCKYHIRIMIYLALTYDSLQFLLGVVQNTPDLYLDELQEMLAVSCGTNVSRTTVWRTLHRTGYTMKKV